MVWLFTVVSIVIVAALAGMHLITIDTEVICVFLALVCQWLGYIHVKLCEIRWSK